MKTLQISLRLIIAIPLLTLLGACSSLPRGQVQRFASVTGLRPEKVAYYEKLHANPWPGVCKQMRLSHIRNYSIYLKQIDGRHYLFSYFEYTGNDFAGDMARMAKDPETRRWWKETDPCQIPLPDAKAKGKIWSDAREVFHLD